MSDFFIRLGSSDGWESDNKPLNTYYPDIRMFNFESFNFRLIMTKAESKDTWDPHISPDRNILVAISGRVALENLQWEQAKEIRGQGGLACKAIYNLYISKDNDQLRRLNGSFAVIIWDNFKNILQIVTDRTGMFPVFMREDVNGVIELSSNADIVGNSITDKDELDYESMAEFLVTGKVTFPNTYYKSIKCLDYGVVHSFGVVDDKIKVLPKLNCLGLDIKIDHTATEAGLSEELGQAFKKAVSRRTLTLFGQTGISLSGGLDSRTILCAADNVKDLWAFCFFDEENQEFKIAEQIAREVGVRFIPFKRDFDHYGSNAEMGIKISGGMGDFGNNHYLGFRNQLREAGIDNLITGFYCDYLFKALCLNKKISKITRTESLSEFKFQTYMPLFWGKTKFDDSVKERLENTFPKEIRMDQSEEAILEIEKRRVFPLSYEPDHQETIVPQRVMGWFLPTVDNDIIDVYLKTPVRYKLNTSLYSKTVEKVCGKKVSAIRNINTGARVNASLPELIYHRYKKAILKRIQIDKKGISTDESWPNWHYYIYNSQVISKLWNRKSELAEGMFSEILADDYLKRPVKEYVNKDLKFFLRLLTLKLWIEQNSI
jgi:hypothetical protein